MEPKTEAQVAILEFGSQHTLEIQRICREHGHLSDIIKPEEFATKSIGRKYRCAIGSGGFRSVYDEGAPLIPPFILPKDNDNPLPYFGICYGMQASMLQLGGMVEPGRAEYANTKVRLVNSPLFKGLPDLLVDVWMSHGDKVAMIPDDFDLLGLSEDGVVAAVAHKRFLHVGVQFHVEVAHTPGGKTILGNFLQLAGCEPNYTPQDLPELMRQEMRNRAGNRRLLIGFSAGVDSSTLAKLASLEYGDDLLAILIDGGHMREGEIEEIKSIAAEIGINLKVVDAQERFFAALKHAGPTEVRDIFSENYADIFKQEAFAWDDGRGVVILQGTIAPDRIESGKTGGAVIKRHHNTGLTFGNIPEVTPLEGLFKDEVRLLGKLVGLPPRVYGRMPFPGPGNFLRGVKDKESAEVVSWADARVREMCKADPRYADIDQLYACSLGRAPGVKGDGPVYGYIIGIRGVRTTRYMTVEGVKFAEDMQEKIDKTLTQGHRLITFTTFIVTDKPPGMVEIM